MPRIAFSVVIPTLNESGYLRGCLDGIREQRPGAEIIVVDGGSTDETVPIALSCDALVCRGQRGRGTQCNTGASLASGDVLLFLHADTRLPGHAFEILERYFGNLEVQIGTFLLGFDSSHWILRGYARFTRFDSLFTRFGDQCIVVRTSFFQQVGGFPDWPLFEDVDFLRTARKSTRIHSFPARVITSARRYVSNGLIKQQIMSAWLLLQFLFGVSPHKLAMKYAAGMRHPD